MALGKTDQSAAGVVYNSLVNQLLTLMDGLRLVVILKVKMMFVIVRERVCVCARECERERE